MAIKAGNEVKILTGPLKGAAGIVLNKYVSGAYAGYSDVEIGDNVLTFKTDDLAPVRKFARIVSP